MVDSKSYLEFLKARKSSILVCHKIVFMKQIKPFREYSQDYTLSLEHKLLSGVGYFSGNAIVGNTTVRSNAILFLATDAVIIFVLAVGTEFF